VYSLDHLLDDIAVAGHQINFMPGQNSIVPAYKLAGTNITACWSTSAVMGPEPIVALMEAIRADDAARVDAIAEDISSVPSVMPPGEAEHFAEHNVQAEKARFNASGYVRCGPTRAPYVDLPQCGPSGRRHTARAGPPSGLATPSRSGARKQPDCPLTPTLSPGGGEGAIYAPLLGGDPANLCSCWLVTAAIAVDDIL
jgi:hypothetical protein